MKTKGPFFEFEKNARGYYWRLRLGDRHCIAVSPRDYETLEEMMEDLRRIIPSLTEAVFNPREFNGME